MNSPAHVPAIGKPAGKWVQACAFLAMALAMGLSFCAAAVRLGLRLIREDQAGRVMLGMAAYLLVAGCAAWAIRLAYRRLKPGRFAWTVVSVYFLVQIALVCSGGFRLPWTGDASLLHHHVQMLSPHGYSVETLGPMSDSYDFQVWSRRAMPFYILIHRLSGPAFPMAIQAFNALIMALAALLTWRLAALLLGTRAAAGALALQVLMPWRIFTHLDLSHHILGSFYYTLGAWILLEWHQPGRSRRQCAGLILAALALMPLMRLEGGIDFVYVGALVIALLLAWLMGMSSFRKTVAAYAALLALPLLSAALWVGPLDALLDAADRHHHDSGILAWSTRGWSIETGGQYDGTYEQLDVLTPPVQKKQKLMQILASQAYYNPAAVAFRQLPTKAAKYFMIGYASGFEEMLAGNGRFILHPLHVGARTAYLLLLLPLAITGSLLFLVWLRTRAGLLFLLPFAVIAGAYVVFGESDPRYSVYIHSYVCLAAGAALAWFRTPEARHATPGRQILLASVGPGISLLLLFAAWSSAIYAIRPYLKPAVLWDMRQASVLGNTPLAVSDALQPFEICLPPVPDAATWGTVQLPLPAGQAAEFTFYLLPVAGLSASRGTPALLRRQTVQGIRDEPITLPARIILRLGPDDSRAFEILSPAFPPPFPVMIGYARLQASQ